MTASEQKITFGEMRASGVRNVLVYCRDHRCSHSIEVSADRWPDHVRLSDIEPGFVCTRWANMARKCGRSFRRPARLPLFPQQQTCLRPVVTSEKAANRATFKEGKGLALFGGNSHSKESNIQAASVDQG
jgi:hypothetical protein